MQYGPVSLLIRGHLHKKSSPLEMWLSFVVQLPCGSTRDGQAQRRQSHTKAKPMCGHSVRLLTKNVATKTKLLPIGHQGRMNCCATALRVPSGTPSVDFALQKKGWTSAAPSILYRNAVNSI